MGSLRKILNKIMSFESFEKPIESKPEVAPKEKNEAERPMSEILKEKAELPKKESKKFLPRTKKNYLIR